MDLALDRTQFLSFVRSRARATGDESDLTTMEDGHNQGVRPDVTRLNDLTHELAPPVLVAVASDDA